MKHYLIKYTDDRHDAADEASMTFYGLDMLDALAYIRHLAIALNMTNFQVVNIYAETDDGTAWDPVPDWADREYHYHLYLAEQAERTKYEGGNRP